jgi:hypothetical protein
LTAGCVPVHCQGVALSCCRDRFRPCCEQPRYRPCDEHHLEARSIGCLPHPFDGEARLLELVHDLGFAAEDKGGIGDERLGLSVEDEVLAEADERKLD